MAVLIDPPAWPAHGRLWSHLASDTSYDELHAFAAHAGVPRRAYEGDHYDVPEERYAALVRAGARPVASRDLLRALQVSGLRLPKRRGERVLRTWPEGRWLPAAGPHRVDCVASPHGPPPLSTIGTRCLALRDGRLALADDGDLPLDDASPAARQVGFVRARFASRPPGGLPWPRAHEAVVGGTGRAGPGVRWVALEDAERVAGERYWWPLVGWVARRVSG